MRSWRLFAEILIVFLRLGLTSFGGPIAHLGYFRQELVERRRWFQDATYADLIALCQFLPGPASSQVAFSSGILRGGLLGGAMASLGFTTPSAVIMIAFGLALRKVDSSSAFPWLAGLRLAAVAIVAQALIGMYRTLCPDRIRSAIGILSALTALAWPSVTVQIVIMVAGGLLGYLILGSGHRFPSFQQKTGNPNLQCASASTPAAISNTEKVLPAFWSPTAWLLFLVLLFGLPLLAHLTGSDSLAAVNSFYRSGALVFGGGHVVLPLLHNSVVANGWVSEHDFIDGYGAAQALPGPLFTFAGFLGTIGAPGGVPGGVLGLLAIFLPGWLLILGTLPYWRQLGTNPLLRAGLRGTNAAVVGILAAAFYRPICIQGVSTYQDLAYGLLLLALLTLARFPSWLVVLIAALIGEFLLR